MRLRRHGQVQILCKLPDCSMRAYVPRILQVPSHSPEAELVATDQRRSRSRRLTRSRMYVRLQIIHKCDWYFCRPLRFANQKQCLVL